MTAHRPPAARSAALAAAALAAACLLPAPVWSGEQPAPRPRSAARPAAPAGEYPSLEALERELARLVEETRPSVVGVVARSSLRSLLGNLEDQIGEKTRRRIEQEVTRRVGSGVVLDSEGHIATVASVVAGASEVDVVPAEGPRLRARIRGVDDDSGVAVLVVEGAAALRPVRLGDAGSLRPGSLVTALGNPRDGSPAYSVGFIAGTGVSHGPLRRGPYLKLDAYTAPGGAGGPVFDARGRLVGLLFGAGGTELRKGPGPITWEGIEDLDPPEGFPGGEEQPSEPADRARLELLRSLHRAGSSGGGVSYAVPVDVLRQVSEQIIRSGSVRRGWLGVTIESLEPGEVLLTRVQAGSPAQKAGLRAEDRIVRIDGHRVDAADEVVSLLALRAPGSPVAITVARGGREIPVQVVLGERPDSQMAFRFRTHPRAPQAPPARLGVLLDSADDAMRQRLGAPQGVGLVVREVWPGSRALAAGLEPGDILIEIGGETVRSVGDVRQVLRLKSGNEMDVRVVREGNLLVLRLPPPPPAPPAPPSPPDAPDRPRRAPRGENKPRD